MENETELPWHVLVVEDELILAALVEEQLLEAGYRVSSASSVAGALVLIQQNHFHAAVLDINVGPDLVFPAAAALQQLGIPFMFATSHSQEDLPGEYSSYALLRKPYSVYRLIETLAGLLNISDVHIAVSKQPTA